MLSQESECDDLRTSVYLGKIDRFEHRVELPMGMENRLCMLWEEGQIESLVHKHSQRDLGEEICQIRLQSGAQWDV